ncbi:MAG: hypothetical protein JSR78_08240 [Proteobacteria bacterium]|nr:hypothetical protein [Pseudomonadota bacterium]
MAPLVVKKLARSRASSSEGLEQYAHLFQTSVSVLNCVIDVGIIRRHIPLIKRAALHFQIDSKRSTTAQRECDLSIA